MRKQFACVWLVWFAAIAAPAAQVPAPPAAVPAVELPDDPLAALAALPALPALREGLEVVVRDADGAVVADAIVVAMSSRDPGYAAARIAAERRYPGDEVRIIAGRAARGQRHAVDAQGMTRVPADLTGRVVVVRGDRLASVIRNPGAKDRRVELHLVPAWSFVVAVHRADGSPATGVPLALLGARGDYPFPRTTTDAAGRATFRVIPGRPPATALVAALIAAPESPSCAMPATDGAEVELKLPPCGSVRAAFAQPLLPGSTPTWSMRSDAGAFVVEPVAATDGAVTFPYVAVGFHGSVSCSLGGREALSAQVAVDEVGHEYAVELASAGDQRSFVVRVLGPDKQPLPASWVRIEWEYANGSSSMTQQTNAEGWLELQVPEGAAAGAKLAFEANAGSWDGPLLGAVRIDVGALAQPRTVHGDVQLAAPVVMLAGTVRDEQGKPVAGARFEGQSTGNYERYRATSDADGAFAIAMPVTAQGTTLLRLDSDEWFFVDTPGDSQAYDGKHTDLRVVVRRGGRLRFHAEGLPEGASNCFSIVCEPSGAEGTSIDLDNDDLHHDAIRLPAGTWDIVFRYEDQEIQRFEKVVVESGVETHDPRFMFFDWQAFAAVVTVHVEDKDGAPTNACTVWRRYGNGASGTSPTDGVISWLGPKDGMHITVEAEDGAIAEIDLGNVTGDRTVRLGGGPVLTVTLSEAVKLPDGATLLVGLPDQHGGAAFDAQRIARLVLPNAGTFALQLRVRRGDTMYELPTALPSVDVDASGGAQAVRVDAALQRVVDRLVGSGG